MSGACACSNLICAPLLILLPEAPRTRRCASLGARRGPNPRDRVGVELEHRVDGTSPTRTPTCCATQAAARRARLRADVWLPLVIPNATAVRGPRGHAGEAQLAQASAAPTSAVTKRRRRQRAPRPSRSRTSRCSRCGARTSRACACPTTRRRSRACAAAPSKFYRWRKKIVGPRARRRRARPLGRRPPGSSAG